MADLATLKVKVDAADAVRQTKQLGDALKQTAMQGPLVSAAMGKTEAQVRQLARAEAAAYREAERMASSHKTLAQNMSTVATSVKGAAAAFAAFQSALAIREVARYADTMTLINARLSIVTKSTQDLAVVQDALFASAQRTRSGFEETAGLYVRVARNADALGRSEAELLKFTELVNMQLQIAGATTAEASSGVMQLGQALSKGKLDGDEFRTVLEAMPTIADALTKSLAGGVRAELFKLAKQGKITGTDIVDAMLAMEQETRRAFSKMPRTIAGAWEQSKNDIIKNIGDIDRATKMSSFFQALARFPGMAAQAINPFGEVPGYGAAQRSLQETINLRQARSMTPEGQAEAATEAAKRRQQALDAVRKAERDAEAERYKAWQEEKKRSDERAKWEMDEINRAQRLVDARLRVSSARAGFSMGAPGAAISGLGGGPVGMGGGVGGVQGAALQGLGVTGQMAEMLRKRLKEQTDAQKAIDDQARKDRSAAETLANQQIAQNFQENMQRALGDILTQFVTDGKFSVKEIFATIKQMGGSMVGQGISTGISKGIEGIFGGTMTAMQSIMSGGVLLGLGSLFGSLAGSSERAARRQAERNAMNLARYNAINAANIRQTETMREWMSGRTAGRGGVVQSVGTVLQETTASRMIGELVAIRVATTRTADAVTSNGSAAGTVVNVTVQGGMAGDAKAVGASVAEAVDRMLGSRVQALRLTSGVAVTT